MAVFKGLEFATKIAEHQEDISSMLNSFDSQSNLLEWLILSKEERDYVADMSYQGYIHLVFQCVVTILHIFLAMPSNAFTLMVIAKNKSLWTFSNMVFVINAFFMALASASNCMFRLSHFPLIFFSEQNRIIAYRVGWWTNFVYFRIGNFRYRSFIVHNYSHATVKILCHIDTNYLFTSSSLTTLVYF